jgi:hypothetical protein
MDTPSTITSRLLSNSGAPNSFERINSKIKKLKSLETINLSARSSAQFCVCMFIARRTAIIRRVGVV